MLGNDVAFLFLKVREYIFEKPFQLFEYATSTATITTATNNNNNNNVTSGTTPARVCPHLAL